jgi:site-specific DNA-methyltransferase (adenine-specific)
MPSSVKDRFTVDFEYLFFLTKNKKYYFEQQFEQNQDKWGRWGKYTNPKSKQNKYHAMSGAKEMDKEEFERKYSKNGRNKRCVWTIPTKPFSGSHFAVYPPELIRTCIQAGCPKNGIVLDPFAGSGTTGEEAVRQGKNYILIELNPEYIKLIKKRLEGIQVKLL